MVGILTSKDLMRRVVALDLDPTLCEVKSIMTANPYYATLDTTILETLHTMHNGKFLHVPVFNKEHKLVGLADVLQVTCGVVQQMGSFQRVRNDSVESLWTQFRNTMLHSDESGEGGDIEDCGEDDDEEEETKNSSVMIENQNASFSTNFTILSQTNETNNRHQKTPESDNQEKKTQDVFVYKLADCYGNNHRFTSSAESVSDLLRDVQKRLGDHTIQQIHYVDDEWEHVSLYDISFFVYSMKLFFFFLSIVLGIVIYG
jgi:signal-transduction protein with cAMP-binding, CBS, and nucleotidyltransferase domain